MEVSLLDAQAQDGHDVIWSTKVKVSQNTCAADQHYAWTESQKHPAKEHLKTAQECSSSNLSHRYL